MNLSNLFKQTSVAALILAANLAHAEHHAQQTVIMKDATNQQEMGEITIEAGENGGLVFTPDLQGLTPGLHGFHMHSNPSCEPMVKQGDKVPAGAAGGHFDPADTQKHSFPWSSDGHKGDLPALYVDQNGDATHPVFAPLLAMEDIEGRALMIHANGDNYSDVPEKLGGGGSRVACGLITK